MNKFSPTRILVMGFFIIILIGSFLLYLPAMNNKDISLLDSIFTATSAVCLTGLLSVNLVEQFTPIGQAIILLLIQLGGLGFMILVTFFFILIKKKITLSNKLIIKEALNTDNIAGFKKLIIHIVKYTLVIELIGTLLLFFTKFYELYGFSKGIWYSIFHSVSAFCNCGMDVIGNSSFVLFQSDLVFNLILMSLIILGGVGFLVWEDVVNKFGKKGFFRNIEVHTKIVFVFTAILLLFGTISFLILEYNNPKVLGNLSLEDKVIASAFQSTTSRTAGFYTVDISELNLSTKLIMTGLMIIGGSPTSMAGGIRTTTFAVLIFILISNIIKNKDEIIIFKRKVSDNVKRKAIFIFILVNMLIFTSVFLLSITEKFLLDEILFEVASAFSNTGLSTGITPYLSDFGKMIIILLMFIGKLGPATIAIAFLNKNNMNKKENINYPLGKIWVG